mmetsp:Transcript_79/g.145  ORF Transcript_79/g.145 Transcript_79/m.145 type:complete len:283 (-) Transcript_79:131-979(-)
MPPRGVSNKAMMLAGGAATYVVSVGLAYNYLTRDDGSPAGAAAAATNTTFTNSCGCQAGCHSYVNDPRRTSTFSNIAYKYDTDIDTDEFVMGIKLLRRIMLYWHAKGNILEVGAGTGRNLDYYPNNDGIKRIVVTDLSDKMLMEAKRKIAKMGQDKRSVFITAEVDAANLSQFPDSSFDTVVDSFGLCSFDDPVAVLKEMQRVCKPDTGKILLLEHGRSKTWEGITRHLDRNAEKHAKNWGCIWNRDIDAIVEEAGLDIDVKDTWHFGTTYYIVARKGKSIA